MIEVFEGRIGGGKTYSAVERMLYTWANGGTVYTNVELIWEECVKLVEDRYSGVLIETDQLQMIEGNMVREIYNFVKPGTPDCPVLVVIDEAHIWLNARDWNQQKRELLDFMTQTRKLSIDFIFITQSQLNIDKQIARLVQFVWRFRDMRKFTIPGLCKWPFPQIYQRCFDYDGKTKMSSRMAWMDKRIFKCYNTNALLSPIDCASGKIVRKKLKRKKGKSKAMRIFVIIAIFLLGYGVYSFPEVMKAYRQIVGKEEVAASAPATAPVAKKEEPRKPGVAGVPDYKLKAASSALIFAIKQEIFRGEVGGVLRSDKGEYRKGSMSLHGLVLGIDYAGRVVHCSGPDGLPVYIVLDDRGIVASAPPLRAVADNREPLVDTKEVTSKRYKYEDVLDRGQTIATGRSDGSELDYAQRIVTDSASKRAR